MKIAIDCHTLEIEHWAGKEQSLFNIVKSLAAVDGENEYILYFRHPVQTKIDYPQSWEVRAFKLPTPFWQIRVLLDMWFITRPRLLFVPCVYLLPAIKFFIPTVVMLHDLTAFIPGIQGTHESHLVLKEKLFVQLALQKSRAVISVSENTKKDCLQYFKVKSEKIKVIYPGNKEQLHPISDEAAINDVLKKNGLPEKFLLSVSTLEPRKNIVNMIKAYQEYDAEAAGTCPPLLVVGKKGWYYEEFFQLVTDLKLEDKVIFTGFLPEEILPVLYSRATLVLYPSLYEGFGSPVLEAMSCGAPVITSNNSSLPEVAGDAALMIDPYSILEIKEAIKKIITDDTLRRELRERGLKRAQNFSWQKFSQELMLVFAGTQKNK